MRDAVRLILIDRADRLLLLKAEGPDIGHVFWLTPGGGVETGESFMAAARRELLEETGLRCTIGPLVWPVATFISGRTRGMSGVNSSLSYRRESAVIVSGRNARTPTPEECLYLHDFKNREEARRAIGAFIEWYNQAWLLGRPAPATRRTAG